MDNWKRSELYCTEALQLDARSLHGIIYKAKQDIDREEYESAQRLLNEANGIDSSNQKVRKMLEKVQTLMRRSKQKDYYKVLGLSRDADDKEIKRAYRRMTLRFHPDKISAEEMSKEQAEKKMASINEAYEVLGDPGLKERYDNGDDPNSPQQGTPFQGSPFGYQSGGQPIYFRQGQGNSFQGAQFKFQGGGFQFPPGFGFP